MRWYNTDIIKVKNYWGIGITRWLYGTNTLDISHPTSTSILSNKELKKQSKMKYILLLNQDSLNTKRKSPSIKIFICIKVELILCVGLLKGIFFSEIFLCTIFVFKFYNWREFFKWKYRMSFLFVNLMIFLFHY